MKKKRKSKIKKKKRMSKMKKKRKSKIKKKRMSKMKKIESKMKKIEAKMKKKKRMSQMKNTQTTTECYALISSLKLLNSYIIIKPGYILYQISHEMHQEYLAEKF